jgi:hypothetical protein
MAHNLLLLQQQLNHLEASYRPPSQLDFVSGATVDNPELAITPRTIGVLSYRILLAHLSSEADQLVLSSAYVDFQTAIQMALFRAKLTTKKIQLNDTILRIFRATQRAFDNLTGTPLCM